MRQWFLSQNSDRGLRAADWIDDRQFRRTATLQPARITTAQIRPASAWTNFGTPRRFRDGVKYLANSRPAWGEAKWSWMVG
jgi:hypothetical protein